MSSEEGGTKINRRPPPQQQQPPPQMMGPPPQMMGPPPQMMGPPPQMMAPPPQVQPQPSPPPMAKKSVSFQETAKTKFGSFDPKMKMAVLVILLFVILNSKIIWKQVCRFPMMGSSEPSMIALLVNSILAGVIFYFISKFVM